MEEGECSWGRDEGRGIRELSGRNVGKGSGEEWEDEEEKEKGAAEVEGGRGRWMVRWSEWF